MTNMEITGDDGVWTTINDLYLWDQNFYANKLGGGQNLIKRYTARGKLNNGEYINYGYGIESTNGSEGQKLSHSGFVCGYPCVQVQYPEEKISIIILSNNTKLLPWEYVDKIKNIILN
jgi:CubicO group peptidase (beta-lactamase class C family)